MLQSFISYEVKDRNIAYLVVSALRAHNPGNEFFWSGDSIPTGHPWSETIFDKLSKADIIISLITNNRTGVNNWINFETGAAIGGSKNLLIIGAPGLTLPLELSRPLQELQYLIWSDRIALKKALKDVGLNSEDSAVEDIVLAFEPPVVLTCTYGIDSDWYNLNETEILRFKKEIENRKEIIIGNHLIGDRDPCPGLPKKLKVRVRRAGNEYEKIFDEVSLINRSDLWN